MRKLIIYLVLSFSFLLTSISQNIPMKIRQQAIEMANASSRGDYNIVLKYTYPKLVVLIGGEAKMKDGIIKGMNNLKAKGITIEKFIIEEPDKIFVAGDELHSLVSEKIIMKTNEGRILINSNLLAVSKDKGLNWYFVECNMDMKLLYELFPNFNKDLKIPERQKPIKYIK